MSIPDLPSFLKEDFVPVKPPHPEFSKAMERYKKHFGRYDFNNWPPSKSENEWAHILNHCVDINKMYSKLTIGEYLDAIKQCGKETAMEMKQIEEYLEERKKKRDEKQADCSCQTGDGTTDNKP